MSGEEIMVTWTRVAAGGRRSVSHVLEIEPGACPEEMQLRTQWSSLPLSFCLPAVAPLSTPSP